MEKQCYRNRACACLRGIEKIIEVVNNAKTDDEKGELLLEFESDLNTLIRTYYLARLEYDHSFKKSGDYKC